MSTTSPDRTVPVAELNKHIGTLLTQSALLHFIATANLYEKADCPEDVLLALIEKCQAQNTEVFTWLDQLSGGTDFTCGRADVRLNQITQ